MRLQAALNGDLRTIMQDEYRQAAKAVTGGIRDTTNGLKLALRDQVTQAGLGSRLARTWQGVVYPKGQASINAAGLVYSKAATIIDAFDRGVTIRSKDGFWLAIPTPEAGKGIGGKRITPGLWEQRTGQRLRFVYRKNAVSLLVIDNQHRSTGKRGGYRKASDRALRTGNGLATVIVFILVPQVTLRKRFDIDSTATTWLDKLPSSILAHWND